MDDVTKSLIDEYRSTNIALGIPEHDSKKEFTKKSEMEIIEKESI